MSKAPLNGDVFHGIRTLGMAFRDAYHLDEFELASVMALGWKINNINNLTKPTAYPHGVDPIPTFSVEANYVDDKNVKATITVTSPDHAATAISMSLSINTVKDSVEVDNKQQIVIHPLVDVNKP